MNKLYAALIFTLATPYSFAAAEKKIDEIKPMDGKPAVVLQVFDISGEADKPITGTTLSIEKKQNKLCWTSLNVPIQPKTLLAEAFYAPDKFKIVSQGSKVDSSADEKNHTIVSEVTNINSPNLSRCWVFNESDPIGKYKMEIQINDYIFKELAFELVK